MKLKNVSIFNSVMKTFDKRYGLCGEIFLNYEFTNM